MKVTTGVMRQEIGELVCKEIEQLVDEKKHLKKYWILVVTNVDPLNHGIIRTKLMIMNKQKPPKMLGTMCFEIDNRKGSAKRLWVLPLDRPWDYSGEDVGQVLLDAQGMPIVHG